MISPVADLSAQPLPSSRLWLRTADGAHCSLQLWMQPLRPRDSMSRECPPAAPWLGRRALRCWSPGSGAPKQVLLIHSPACSVLHDAESHGRPSSWSVHPSQPPSSAPSALRGPVHTPPREEPTSSKRNMICSSHLWNGITAESKKLASQSKTTLSLSSITMVTCMGNRHALPSV